MESDNNIKQKVNIHQLNLYRDELKQSQVR